MKAGQVLGVASNEYALRNPAAAVERARPCAMVALRLSESIRQVMAKTGVDATAVKGIGLTGQMHGLVLLDEKGDVLRPSILWNDQRTGCTM